MILNYLLYEDRKEFLKLFDAKKNDNEWEQFWATYEESDSKIIYVAHEVIKDKDVVIGSVSLLVEYKVYLDKPVIHIDDLIVLKKYRELGIGTTILTKVLEECKSYCPHKIILSCPKEYLEFYQGFDFKEFAVAMELT